MIRDNNASSENSDKIAIKPCYIWPNNGIKPCLATILTCLQFTMFIDLAFAEVSNHAGVTILFL